LNSGQQKAAFHGCLLLLHKNWQMCSEAAL
jgi:hypothetical protein